MKILQINNCHFRRGGADVVYLNTGKLLSSKGHEVIYFSTKSKKNCNVGQNNFFVDEINYFKPQPPLKRFFTILNFFFSFQVKNNLESLIELYKPDVAHIHLYKGQLTSAIFHVLNKKKIPVVFSVHDYGLVDPHNLLLDSKGNIFEKTINGSSFNSVLYKTNRNSFILSFISFLEYKFTNIFFPFDKYINRVLCVSKFAHNKISESKKFNFNSTQLYNFHPDLYSIMPNKTKGKYFIFIGRISKEKGIDILIEAFTKMKTKGILKIVGDGDLLAAFKRKKYKNIQFLGFKSEDEVNELLVNSSFNIVPSQWYENNPLTVIESYVHGVPVIGSKIGGIPEIIVDKKTGYLFNPKDIDMLSKILDLANQISKHEYSEFSKNSRKLAEKLFNPNIHYKSLMRIYKQVIKENEH